LVIGKRGCGKSTLINRILGEKKAYAHINAKTPETREYYHRYYPIKLIDSAGFEVGGLDEKKTNEIKDIKKFLEENNLAYKNIKKRVHFIFYVFRANDKFDDSVIQILKEFQSYNIETIFIITYSKQGEEKIYKNNFKGQLKKNNIFPKEKINNIINNTFCLDSFNIKYSKVISDIFLYIAGILKEYEESNNIIIDAIENCKNLIKNKEDDNLFDSGDDLNFLDISNDIPPPTPLSSESFNPSESFISSFSSSRLSVGLNIAKDTEKGKIFKKSMNNPKETIKMVKSLIQTNIFLTDFKSERLYKKKLANEVVEQFMWPGFWWSSFMIPILNQYLAKKSKLKMLRRISEIYDIEIPKDYDENFFNSIKEKDGIFKKCVKTIGTWISGYWNFNDVKKIGNKIIEEYDLEYTKKNILDLYMDMAVKYNESFRMIQNFYTCFNQDYWYDIRLKN
jgi:GTP-binding protein EngB required for normal cell division